MADKGKTDPFPPMPGDPYTPPEEEADDAPPATEEDSGSKRGKRKS